MAKQELFESYAEWHSPSTAKIGYSSMPADEIVKCFDDLMRSIVGKVMSHTCDEASVTVTVRRRKPAQ